MSNSFVPASFLVSLVNPRRLARRGSPRPITIFGGYRSQLVGDIIAFAIRVTADSRGKLAGETAQIRQDFV